VFDFENNFLLHKYEELSFSEPIDNVCALILMYLDATRKWTAPVAHRLAGKALPKD
jgi:hypothetical protein